MFFTGQILYAKSISVVVRKSKVLAYVLDRIEVSAVDEGVARKEGGIYGRYYYGEPRTLQRRWGRRRQDYG
jgi:hypothetical protein